MSQPGRPERHLRIAAALLVVQGVMMEGVVFVGLLILLALRVPQTSVATHAQIFGWSYLQQNLYAFMALSGVFAALRITGAVALWRGRLWGLALSVLMAAVTLTVMIVVLPVGVMDGILSGLALALMLRGWLGLRGIHGQHAASRSEGPS